MAAAFARKYGGERIEVFSAGTQPAVRIHPEVMQVMREKGLDLGHETPKLLNMEWAQTADAIITMGCSLEGLCPAPLLKKAVDWGLEDPKGKPLETVRQIRDQIERKVIALLDELRH
jgi:protein-tyrosine-phosphatase